MRLASHPVSPFPVKSRLAAPPNQTTLPTLPTAAQPVTLLLQSVSHSGPDQTVVQQHCSLSKSNLLTTLQITCAFTQSKNIVSLRPPSSSFFSKTFIQESVFLDSSIEGQGCISCGTCSCPELTEDHVLTSAYVKIFRTVTRNAVNKSF